MEADHTTTDENEGAHVVVDVPPEAVKKALESIDERQEWLENNPKKAEKLPETLTEETVYELEEWIYSHVVENHEITVAGVPLNKHLSENY